jgi:hypothetical membrane protein
MSGARRDSAWLAVGIMAGVIGPCAFTAAWIIASLRQPGYGFTQIQISGLAAPGARNPSIMMAGFLVLGASLIVFGFAFRRQLDDTGHAGRGPLLIQIAGVLTLAAGLLRRDHMLLTAGQQSWHNDAHNIVSAALYLLLIAVPLTLARRLRKEPRWRSITGPLAVAALVSAVILAVFISSVAPPWQGTLQRIGVSLPLASLIVVALVMRHISARQPRSTATVRTPDLPRPLTYTAPDLTPTPDLTQAPATRDCGAAASASAGSRDLNFPAS